MDPLPLLSGKTAVVTGAASGIGRGIARSLAEWGADVVVADVRDEPREGGTPTHEAIRKETDAEATFASCDVTNRDDLISAVGTADDFGGVDVMVNNAGVFETKAFTDVTEADYERIMNVNAKGVFFGAQAAAERMLNRGAGSIINISSVAGIEGGGTITPYSGSKGAVRLMTYSMAGALGPSGIRVNAIHPGPTDTQLLREDLAFVGTETAERYVQTVPSRRLATPSDIGGVAVFLASDLAGYVNGESILVDGGNVNTRGLW